MRVRFAAQPLLQNSVPSKEVQKSLPRKLELELGIEKTKTYHVNTHTDIFVYITHYMIQREWDNVLQAITQKKQRILSGANFAEVTFKWVTRERCLLSLSQIPLK